MASLQLPLISAAHLIYGITPTTNTCSSTLKFFLNHQKPKHALRNKLPCRATKESSKGEQEDVGRGKFDRRDILLGLGGIYAGTSSAVSQSALAIPVEPTTCGNATLPTCTNIKDGNCCPPAQPIPHIHDFEFPRCPADQRLRVRPAAHLVDQEYIKKYNEAMGIMRSLPEDHPHSFAQQAAIHCAYCNFAYEMVNFPVKLDVHFSWLFFPFHRWYLYFFEKILGSLIGDPYFAIPYWNWDSPAGMPMPLMFADPYSPLYDKLRNDKHYPPLPVDLDYSTKVNCTLTGDTLLECNLRIMHRQMVRNSATTELFFGGAYKPVGADVGTDQRTYNMGSIENQPHTQVHIWTGDPNQPNGEDMGRFYSAGRDPIFYAHHANVDRLWNIWKDMDVEKHKDIDDRDWLDSSFLLYDERERLVRVKIRDCLDTTKLGYTYQKVPLIWLNYRPIPVPAKEGGQGSTQDVVPTASEVFPKVLDDLLKVTVPRPKKSRTPEEKDSQEEILVIDGIEYDGDEYVKFDVHINGGDDKEEGSGSCYADFAGVFSNVPSTKKVKVKATQLFGLSKLLEDLEAEDDDSVVVALVPKTGKGKVTIGSAKIVLSDY